MHQAREEKTTNIHWEPFDGLHRGEAFVIIENNTNRRKKNKNNNVRTVHEIQKEWNKLKQTNCLIIFSLKFDALWTVELCAQFMHFNSTVKNHEANYEGFYSLFELLNQNKEVKVVNNGLVNNTPNLICRTFLIHFLSLTHTRVHKQ